ncbi:hypothetical protein TYRP_016645 [Tyrophagus putrescentiae]|nr:hypothetical protein TYRP_016645 [Tyrophagus putrescentiae]
MQSNAYLMSPWKFLTVTYKNTERSEPKAKAKGSATVSSAASRRSTRIQGSSMAVEERCTAQGSEVCRDLTDHQRPTTRVSRAGPSTRALVVGQVASGELSAK